MLYNKLASENLLTIKMQKIKVNKNKAFYLRLSILEISKLLMPQFQYDSIQPKDRCNAKLCYINKGSFTVHIKMFIKH